MQPHKIQINQPLRPFDMERRLGFANEIIESIENGNMSLHGVNSSNNLTHLFEIPKLDSHYPCGDQPESYPAEDDGDTEHFMTGDYLKANEAGRSARKVPGNVVKPYQPPLTAAKFEKLLYDSDCDVNNPNYAADAGEFSDDSDSEIE
ncbi:hypothetical protein QE152_g795 [Popillia japonica]|uniref:Uncharacterized protein n=1 Tax=Popillia japonica TaxID=7064 RepID=A0AAW1N4I6_POPJA